MAAIHIIYMKITFDFINGVNESNHKKMRFFRFYQVVHIILAIVSFFLILVVPELLHEEMDQGYTVTSIVLLFALKIYEFIVIESVFQKIRENYSTPSTV